MATEGVSVTGWSVMIDIDQAFIAQGKGPFTRFHEEIHEHELFYDIKYPLLSFERSGHRGTANFEKYWIFLNVDKTVIDSNAFIPTMSREITVTRDSDLMAESLAELRQWQIDYKQAIELPRLNIISLYKQA